MLTADRIWEDVTTVRHDGPLVHNITNYVVMNSTANALLALGASPVMAHAAEEVTDMVDIAGALVVNIGTLDPPWVEAMHRALTHAVERGVPVVLDPVGAGATPYRTETALALLDAGPPTIVRGNASEIMALVSSAATTRGVDSADATDAALDAAHDLHDRTGATVVVTGATDYVVGGPQVVRIANGDPLMARVTGLGCTASALCGAFTAVDDEPWRAAGNATAVSGIVGEIAAESAAGPGTLQLHLLDALYGLNHEQLERRLRADTC